MAQNFIKKELNAKKMVFERTDPDKIDHYYVEVENFDMVKIREMEEQKLFTYQFVGKNKYCNEHLIISYDKCKFVVVISTNTNNLDEPTVTIKETVDIDAIFQRKIKRKKNYIGEELYAMQKLKERARYFGRYAFLGNDWKILENYTDSF